MTITVNQQTIELFEGAQVRHALLRYFVLNNLDKSEIDRVEILDKYGHVLDLDAPLSNAQALCFDELLLAKKEEPAQDTEEDDDNPDNA